MIRHYRNYIVIFLAAAVIAGCGKVPDNARYIPADAVAVVGLNIRSLGKKIAWNLITGSKLFKEIQKRMPEKNAGDAIGGIENAGFDVSNTFYVYTKPDSRFENGNLVAGLLPLSDAAQWETYVKGAFPGVQITERSGRKEAILGNDMYVAWTDKLLIVLNATTIADDEHPRDTASDRQIMLAEMDKAFTVSVQKSLADNERYKKFEGHGYDLSFWLNYGSLVSSYTENMNMDLNGISLSSAVWKDAILTTGFNFNKGKISGDISYYLPAQVEEAAKAFGEQPAGKDMLDKLPKQNLDLLLSMHISPKGVKSLLEKIGLFGITNVGLTAQGLDVDYVLDAFDGDMAVLINDFSLDAETVTDSFMGQMVAHKQQKANMSITYVVKANKQANFDKLLQMTAGTQMLKAPNGYVLPITAQDSVHLVQDGSYTVISNKRNYAYGFIDGRFEKDKMPRKMANKVYDQPFAMCLDISQLFKDVDPAISSVPRDSAMISEGKKLLDNITLHGGKFKDNAYQFKMEVNFLNTDENSILELIDFGMRMNDIDRRQTQ
jgi:hypothetical protein